jgi:hypothetical protein
LFVAAARIAQATERVKGRVVHLVDAAFPAISDAKVAGIMAAARRDALAAFDLDIEFNISRSSYAEYTAAARRAVQPYHLPDKFRYDPFQPDSPLYLEEASKAIGTTSAPFATIQRWLFDPPAALRASPARALAESYRARLKGLANLEMNHQKVFSAIDDFRKYTLSSWTAYSSIAPSEGLTIYICNVPMIDDDPKNASAFTLATGVMYALPIPGRKILVVGYHPIYSTDPVFKTPLTTSDDTERETILGYVVAHAIACKLHRTYMDSFEDGAGLVRGVYAFPSPAALGDRATMKPRSGLVFKAFSADYQRYTSDRVLIDILLAQKKVEEARKVFDDSLLNLEIPADNINEVGKILQAAIVAEEKK